MEPIQAELALIEPKPSVQSEAPLPEVVDKKPYHHGNLHTTLLDVTKQLLQEKGVHELSLREVARRAGVSRTAPYRHFKDKEALLAAVAIEGFETLTQEMRRSILRSGDRPVNALQDMILMYVQFLTKNKAYLPLMFGPFVGDMKQHEELLKAKEAMVQTLLEVVKRTRDKKGDSQEQIHVLTVSAWAIMHGAASLITEGHIPEALNMQSKQDFVGRQAALAFIRGLVN